VQVKGVDDDVGNADDRTATVTVSVRDRLSSDECDGQSATVAVTAADYDTAGLAVSATTAAVAENAGTGTFTVALSSQPAVAVKLALASGDASVATVSPGELDFTSDSWNLPQTVTVTGVDDDVANRPARTAGVLLAVTEAGPSDAYAGFAGAVTATDDDMAGLSVSETALSVDEDSGTGTFTVALTSQPAGAARLTAASGDAAAATASPAGLAFTAADWNAAQTVTVTGVDDDVANDPDRTATVTVEVDPESSEEYRGLSATVTVPLEDAALAAPELRRAEADLARVLAAGATAAGPR